MISIKTEKDLEIMRVACKITKETLDELEKHIRPNITTKELDNIARKFIKSKKAKPSFLNYNGYPASICTSINEQVVHGIPSERVLNEGDIISIDVGVYYNGFHGDACRTFAVGNISPELQRLIDVTKESFFEGIKGIKAGSYVGDISNQIQTYVEKNGYSVVRALIGHGIGRNLHEDPEVPNFGERGTGAKLLAGMTIAVEPMVNMGKKNVEILDDGWTVVTKDGKPSAHYENTILITENGVEILTI